VSIAAVPHEQECPLRNYRSGDWSQFNSRIGIGSARLYLAVGDDRRRNFLRLLSGLHSKMREMTMVEKRCALAHVSAISNFSNLFRVSIFGFRIFR
jgi:hypothetical protein